MVATLHFCIVPRNGPRLRRRFQLPALLPTSRPHLFHGGQEALYECRVGSAGHAPLLVGVSPHRIQLLGSVLAEDEHLLPFPEKPPPAARFVRASGVQLPSHVIRTPAPRDLHTFDQAKAPRLASFNEKDVSDKPSWIQSLGILTSTDIANIDRRHEDRVESLQAVDDLVAAVVGKLGSQGVLSNTYIVFTSDNGFHHGEHRIQRGKGRPYEESVRVPLVIRGPNVQTSSSTDKLVLNTDYLPTFMNLAGAQTPPLRRRAFFASSPHRQHNALLLEDSHPD
jgi:hypothetical protein